MSNPYSQYQKTQVTTASREKVLLMLYEGAIRFTKHAHSAMKQGKIAEKGKYISKATAILSLAGLPDFARDGRTFQVVGTKAVAQPVQFRLFDPERGTLVQVDTINDGRQVTERIRYGDFREVDGVLEPFETVLGEGPQRVTIRTVKLANRFAPPPGFFEPSAAQVKLWQRTEDCEVPTSGATTTLPKGFGVLFEAIPMETRAAIASLVQSLSGK